MASLVPRTALPGRSRSSHDELARGLGYFSIALGMTELIAPDVVCRAAAMDGQETVVRAYGVREIATGIAILASHDPTPWIWGRVAGDALDIATVAAGSPDRSGGRNNKIWALAALVGVTALDAYCAASLKAEKGGVNTARADYSNRSGFPKGVNAARGAAAGSLEKPRNTPVSEAHWPQRSEQARQHSPASAMAGQGNDAG